MKKETSKRLSAGLLASAIALNTVLSISADDGSNIYSAGESGVQGTFTSAPDISFLTIGASSVELNDGNFTDWIDRVKVEDYAEAMYTTISSQDFWTNPDNFSESGDNLFSATYGNGSSDKFNGLLVCTQTRDYEFTAEEKGIVKNHCRAAYDAFDRDNPEIFWLTGETNFKQIVTTVTENDVTTYTMNTYLVLKDYNDDWDMRHDAYQDTGVLSTAIQKMNEEVSEIISDAGDSAYEKIKYFNDYLVTVNEYNTVVSGGGEIPEDSVTEAYCAIMGATGDDGPVCEGYARAFKVLCDKAGIPCVLTDGTANGGAHMWNYASVDGTWYAVDVTWDDTAGGENYDNYLLVGYDTVINGSAFGDSHTVANKASLDGVSFTNGPALNSDAYVPAVTEKEYVASIGSDGFETLAAAAEAASAGDEIIILDDITLESNVSFDEAVTIDLAGNKITAGEYSVTAESPVSVKDTATGGAVDGAFLFNDGGSVDGADMGIVTVSGGTFEFSGSSADILSVSASAAAAVSDSSFGEVSVPSGIASILAEDQMYYVDGTVISADKLEFTSLSGDVAVKEGLASGIIVNDGYETSYTYNGNSIPEPSKEDFTYYGAEPVFVWKSGSSKLDSAPSEAGTYTLVATSGASGKVDSAELTITVTIGEYDSDVTATLTGEKGNDGWIISDAQLVAPNGYLISDDGNNYADSINYTDFTNQTITYSLKEISTGFIATGLKIDVKVDKQQPWFSKEADASVSSTAVSIQIYGADDSGNELTYSARMSDSTSSGTINKKGTFSFSGLTPETNYNIIVTITDPAGNSFEGVVPVTTAKGDLSKATVKVPTLTGVYGTAVKDMEISGGSVKYGTTTVDGVWTVTDINADEIPDVGTKNEYQLTFTPVSSSYTSVTKGVVPRITPLSIADAVITGVDTEYKYTGDVIKPDPQLIIVSLDGKALAYDKNNSKSSDYIVEYGSNKNSGPAAGTVTVRGVNNYNNSVSVNFDILKADNVITCFSTEEWKHYGDEPFTLSLTTNNSETSFVYNIGNSDVVEMTGKNMVSIKGAGTAAITVSQPETANYNESTSVTIFVIVSQADAIHAGEIEESFIYSAESKGEIDIAEKIIGLTDEKCGKLGTLSVSEKTDSAKIISNARVSDRGMLTFDVGKGAIGDYAIITVKAETQNYESVTVDVVITLDDKYATKEKGKVTAGNNLIYGQPLSDITFKPYTFVTTDGKQTVSGKLEWENPDYIPSVSEKTANWKFTPDNTEIYKECSGTASIVVKKAVPTVDIPVVQSMVYNSERRLSDVVINGADGKSVVNGSAVTVAGKWSWSKPATIPDCKTKEYVAVFTPDDSVNYESVEVKVPVTVTKAQAQITKEPVASDITYGQKVSDSALKNGTADTAGKFTWSDGDKSLNAGEYTLDVDFTPNDTVNYIGTSTKVKLKVNKAKNAPDMPASRINASYDITSVGGVELPAFWYWDIADAEKGLAVGSSATATAVYSGHDKGNYEIESILVTITRSKCSHKKTKVINEKKATCTEKGYSGDTYCSDCDTVTVKGKEVAVIEHSGGKATCSALAVCTHCKKPYGDYDKEKHSGTKVIKNAIAATPSAAGYTGDVCCSACGAVIEKGVIIPPNEAAVTTTSSDKWNDVTTTTSKKPGSTTTDSKDEIQPFIYKNEKKYGWNDIITDVTDTKIGDTVEVDMNGTSEIPTKVLRALRGKNVDLVLHMNRYFSWVVNGMDIQDSTNIDLEVYEGNENISVDLIDQVTGDAYSTTLTLTHNGEFGFSAVLRYEVGSPGYYANLYYYNPGRDTASFVTSDKIDDKGVAELEFDHASEYIIVIDTKDHSGRAENEYNGNDRDDDDSDYEDDDSDNNKGDNSNYEEDDGNDDYDDVILDEDLFYDSDDYYTGGEKNPATGLNFGHVLVGILGVSAFIVRPKNEKRSRKAL